jgi:DNA-binding CsgD family transcriptional regulator
LTFVPRHICRNDNKAELEKALNRVDFFRIFHSLALKHHFEHFCILQLHGDRSVHSLAQHLVLHDLPNGLAEDYDKRYQFGKSGLLDLLHATTLPSIWHDCDADTPKPETLMRQLGFDLAICIPVHSHNGGRFAVLFLGDRDPPDIPELAELHYNSSFAFDYFYQKVLGNKKGMGLTARETEILRWISHGKTASEVALIVSVSEHTINSHTATILKKMDVVNRTQMVAKAIREQIID